MILLYERIKRDLDEARQAIAKGDTEARHQLLMHAQQIIEELSYALRPELWDGCDGMLALYDYMLSRLVEANVEASTVVIDEVAGIVGHLTEAWRSAYVSLTPATTSA